MTSAFKGFWTLRWTVRCTRRWETGWRWKKPRPQWGKEGCKAFPWGTVTKMTITRSKSLKLQGRCSGTLPEIPRSLSESQKTSFNSISSLSARSLFHSCCGSTFCQNWGWSALCVCYQLQYCRACYPRYSNRRSPRRLIGHLKPKHQQITECPKEAKMWQECRHVNVNTLQN